MALDMVTRLNHLDTIRYISTSDHAWFTPDVPTIPPVVTSNATIIRVFDVDAETPECAICMDKYKTCIFIPCGHYCTCDSCAFSVTECPICRSAITTIMDAR